MLKYDKTRDIFLVNDKPYFELSASEHKILKYLFQNIVATPEQLINIANLNKSYNPNSNVITVYIHSINQKLKLFKNTRVIQKKGGKYVFIVV